MPGVRHATRPTPAGNGTGFELRDGIEFVVHDGVPLRGDLYLPRHEGPHPLVIGVHGGAWQRGDAGRWCSWGEWLAARGQAFFAMTYRLAAPGRKAFPECFHDVRAAVQFARGNAHDLGIDQQRMALMGASAGAHLAALVALAGDRPEFAGAYPGDIHSAVSTRVKAVVPIYGIFDLYQQWQHDIVSRPHDPMTERLLGVSPVDDKRAYVAASPLSYVPGQDDLTSFLVVWGTRDDIVDHHTQSEAFVLALEQAGRAVQSLALEGAPHAWVSDSVDAPGTWTHTLAPRLLRFLEQQLQ